MRPACPPQPNRGGSKVPSNEQDHNRAVWYNRGKGSVFELPSHFANLNSGAGQHLPQRFQQKAELAFGADFSDIRIHVGPEAELIGALAFACGSRIYIAPGHYNPHTPRGQQLLGHELTHVIQQRAGRVNNPFGSGVALVQDQALEEEAHRMSVILAADSTQETRDDPLPPVTAQPPVRSAVANGVTHGVIQPLVMHGQPAGGGFGALTANEIRDWINNKIVRVGVPLANVAACANYIMNWPPPGGGGGTNLHFGGNLVIHISHGLLGGPNGCSVFFTNPHGDHVKIVGVGWHNNPMSPTRYRLDWGTGSGPWHANTVICINHGPNCPGGNH